MEDLIISIAAEVREDFQIPPFFSDYALQRKVKESVEYFQKLNPTADLSSDVTFKELVKNRTFYSYYHKLDEFSKNYFSDILAWQLETPIEEVANEN